MEYHLALVTGRPVDETGKVLFEAAHRELRMLCGLGRPGQGYVDAETLSMFLKGMENGPGMDFDWLTSLTPADLTFLHALWDIAENSLCQSKYRAGDMEKEMGMSKSRLYRRMKSLLGMSPGTFIREIRLRRSLDCLKQPGNAVAEVAYGQGFNSPNYFSRLFKKRYGILPSAYAAQSL